MHNEKFLQKICNALYHGHYTMPPLKRYYFEFTARDADSVLIKHADCEAEDRNGKITKGPHNFTFCQEYNNGLLSEYLNHVLEPGEVKGFGTILWKEGYITISYKATYTYVETKDGTYNYGPSYILDTLATANAENKVPFATKLDLKQILIDEY